MFYIFESINKGMDEQIYLLKKIIGENAELLFYDGEETAGYFDELTDFGSHFSVNYVIKAKHHKFDVAIYSGIKLYNSERAKKFHVYGYQGNIFVINNIDIVGKYCYLSGKPFRKPMGENWSQVKRDGKKIWVGNTSDDIDIICKLINLLEKEICVLQSYRYALYIQDGIIRLFFWEPDIFVHHIQIEMYKDAVDKICECVRRKL